MNFKKRSEFCGKSEEVKDVTVHSSTIEGGVVFSGEPERIASGVFLKINKMSRAQGFVRLAYSTTEHSTGFFLPDRNIKDYKELNVTLVDEDA